MTQSLQVGLCARLRAIFTYQFRRANMAHFKCPKSVSFIDALPRTATGKIQKDLSREKYWQRRCKRLG